MRRVIGMALLVTVLLMPPAALAQRAGSSATPQADTAASWIAQGSTAETVMFFVIGGMAAACALGCVLSVNIVRMAVWLFGTLGAVAILYFLMAANFLAAIQLIVYAGGTLLVIIFGVMLTSKSPWVKYAPKPVELAAGAVVCGLLFGGLVIGLYRVAWKPAAGVGGAGGTSVWQVADIGGALLTTYLVPFELASVLLLAVMMGAAYLARPERKSEERQ